MGKKATLVYERGIERCVRPGHARLTRVGQLRGLLAARHSGRDQRLNELLAKG